VVSNDHSDTQSGTSGLEKGLGTGPLSIPIDGHLSDREGAMTGILPGSLEFGSPQDRSPTGIGSDVRGDLAGMPETLGPALEFRVIRPGAPVRRLRLTGNRYTFGSGEGCSIRLDDTSLRPMHAVLLRDAHRILMRAYSIPLDCNGTRVTEAVLRIGDIIRMGNYRFELLSAPGLPASPSSPLQLPLSQDRGDSHLRDRLAALSQQWHVRHAECEIRETRCDQRESALHGRETELWSRAESLQHRERLLMAQEAAAREIQETYAATQEELKSLRLREAQVGEELQEKEAELIQKSEQLRERQSELQRRQAEWHEREEQYAERAAEAQRKLEQTQQQAQSANAAVGRMRTEFATLNEQLTELRERHSQLQERERREQVEHDRLRNELVSARDQAIDRHAKGELERSKILSDLQRVTADLESTREALTQIRQESKDRQLELSEKLRATGRELQATREESEKSRRAAEEEHAYNENRIAELEERLATAAEFQATSQSGVKQELDELLRKHQAAELERNAAENQRELAEQGRRDAEEARQAVEEELKAAEERLKAAETQLDAAEVGRAAAEDGRRGAEEVAEGLHENIRQLQESVAKATAEAAQLRDSYEGANASIRQLELLVDQTQTHQSSRNDSWEQESEQLRLTIEDLSLQLSNANAELGELRAANEALASELAGGGSDPDNQRSGEQPAIESEQFRILELELESARRELEQLQDTHAETVSRLETERHESESALRDEIEKLRDEIASVQQSAEARFRQFHDDGYGSDQNLRGLSEIEDQSEAENPGQERSDADAQSPLAAGGSTADDDSGTNDDQLVVSGDNVWRMESEQTVEKGAHLFGWSEDHAGDPTAERIEAEEDDPTTRWLRAENPSDSTLDPPDSERDRSGSQQAEGQIDESVRWNDEAPEDGVADAIDEIEHNVEQAISGFEPVSESQWPDIPAPNQTAEPATDDVTRLAETGTDGADGDTSGSLSDMEVVRQYASRPSSEADKPLDWSAYMPGGVVEEVPEDLDAPSGQERPEPLGDEDDATQPVQDRMGEDGFDFGGESESLASQPDTDRDFHTPMHPPEPGAAGSSPESEPTQPWGQADEETPGEDLPLDDRLPIEKIGQTTGSLAEMLIRDLESDDAADRDDARAAEIDEEIGTETTFVLEGDLGAVDDESEPWNLRSPESGQGVPFASEIAPSTMEEVGDAASAPLGVPDDDSIEAYMSRLLQRVQTDELATGAAVSSQPNSRSASQIPGSASSPVASRGATSREAVSGFDSPEDEPSEISSDSRFGDSSSVDFEESSVDDTAPLVPRSQAPELAKGLTAMRDLANQSARNAVTRSIRIQARDTQMKATLKFGLTACFIAMAIGVFLFVNWSSTIKIAMVGAFLVLAGVFGQEGYVLARDARRRLSLAEGHLVEAGGDEEVADPPRGVDQETEQL
jgi:hypothetical protein